MTKFDEELLNEFSELVVALGKDISEKNLIPVMKEQVGQVGQNFQNDINMLFNPETAYYKSLTDLNKDLRECVALISDRGLQLSEYQNNIERIKTALDGFLETSEKYSQDNDWIIMIENIKQKTEDGLRLLEDTSQKLDARLTTLSNEFKGLETQNNSISKSLQLFKEDIPTKFTKLEDKIEKADKGKDILNKITEMEKKISAEIKSEALDISKYIKKSTSILEAAFEKTIEEKVSGIKGVAITSLILNIIMLIVLIASNGSR